MFNQELIVVYLVYNKDITCVIDQGLDPVCKVSERIKRRSNVDNIPSHDPYIPRNNSVLYNCSLECDPVTFKSMTELTSPSLFLKSCFPEITENDTVACENVRYNYLKNSDKILFLSKIIPEKSFYTVDCLIYSDGGRVCHKHESGSHVDLVDTGTLARPKELNVLAQEEFICEESKDKEVNCDLNPYVPFDSGLKLKESMKFDDSVIIKSGTYIVPLKRVCTDIWCGYSGHVSSSRRQYSYSPPGGKIFRCYYARKQQVCKMVADPSKLVYNKRGWLDGRR
ncbi:unnamed protein product [Chrysodeixis includens]|uniref:Uncharacterized protein n=1 Tax=Chrysodeixis includens TaxID=689277 RepID=A0A9P0C193_CHRIL|nr:unnamed protein product [Chrysodeixis includens]